jgi:hypothetical protein
VVVYSSIEGGRLKFALNKCNLIIYVVNEVIDM